jgi:DNA-binding transcriptional LysR family regulator
MVVSSGYPQIELEVETAASGHLNQQLQRGQLDLAVLVSPVSSSATDLPLRTFGTTEPVWVAALGYQLVADKPVPLALHGQGCPYRSVAVDALTHQGRAWRTVVMTAGVSALETTICAGMAIGIIDRARVSGHMRILGADDGLPTLPLHELRLVKAPGEPGPASDLLIDLISDHFRP